ncbi:hypothetical protein [Bacillus tropicus]|uniref:hypothetical protein n=1 Tax=Bacillus tropicus TaxID=2026188 RepID=UPI0009470A8C|nr:hypothetical protein [Bacillus tropicus]MBH0346357.1 amino acid transporter [Bacillus thuringiensis]OTY05313.1 hypothetical protein BK731_16760 [Bacillus thuringiensis serovar muju]PEU79660.1 hypothetical protein CN386_11635 [Bacillus cereus]PGT74188.1 hypothetical protein COD14_15295 [Bacillus cereus]PGV91762.1 hypothetical protein COD86_22465 [Bacillus cereus]
MSGTIIILLYICFGLSAVFSLIKELKKPQKNQFLILVDSLILLGALILLGSIFI